MGTVLSSNRSAGPLMAFTGQTPSEHFQQYWKTGISSSSPRDVEAATLLNPTFVYSLAGEGCNVHYASDPLTSFHLATLFGNSKKPVTVSQMVQTAKAEFADWCSAYHASISVASSSRPVVRFITADATVACRSMHAMATTETLKLNIAVAQWKTQFMELSREEYVTRRAPTTFNVIETSNLDDHLGPLNVLTATVPLLSRRPSSVIYTESLLSVGADATKEFAEHLYADVTSLALIIGLCPVAYLCAFTSRSNTHELILNTILKKHAQSTRQFHEVTTWRAPTSGDTFGAEGLGRDRSSSPSPSITFDSRQLATFLYDMYHQLFEQEDARTFFALNQNNFLRAVQSSDIVHYVRESFVLFLKLVRDRRNIADQQWIEIMDYFFDFIEADQSMPMDSVNQNDFYAQLHRHGVYTVDSYRRASFRPKIGRFVNWPSVPPLVRIILTVPKEKLHILEHGPPNEIGTPPLQCGVRGKWMHNLFSSIHVVYGRAIPMGTKACPWATFKEDSEGRRGQSPMIVSFVMPTQLLTGLHEPPEDLSVELSLRSTPATTMKFYKHFGMELAVYSARLMDESKVIVLPENPLPNKRESSSSSSLLSDIHSQIGSASPVAVDLDEQCELVASMTSRITVDIKDVQVIFQSGAIPQISQISPCRMRLTLGDYQQDAYFPFPVSGSQNKLRLARKSLYIEVIVPPAGPFKPDGMKLNPFPVIRHNSSINPWNIHRINLHQLPVLDVKAPALDKWLNPHFGSMFSTRERGLRKKHEGDALMLVKDSLHSIFLQSAGIHGGPPQRLFSLRDATTNNIDTLFFISDLRYDLSCHTVVCDGHVLPLRPEIVTGRMSQAFGRLVTKGKPVPVSIISDVSAVPKKREQTPRPDPHVDHFVADGLKLKTFQSEDLDTLAELERNYCEGDACGRMIAYATGMGKTALLLALTALNRSPAGSPTLVICPNIGVLQHRESEMKKFTPQLTYELYYGGNKPNAEKLSKCDVILATYAQVTRQHTEWLADHEFHNARNPDTKPAKACWDLQKTFAFCLSATPAQNSVLDFFSAFKFLEIPDHDLDDLATFRELIITPVDKGLRERTEAQTILTDVLRRYMVYRPKGLLGLPPRHDRFIKVRLNTDEKLVYHHVEVLFHPQPYARFTRTRQICTHPYLTTKAVDPQEILQKGDPEVEDKPQRSRRAVDDITAAFSHRRRDAIHEGDHALKAVRHVFDPSYKSSKIIAMTKILQQIRSRPGNEKTIVFAQFKLSLDLLHSVLLEQGFKCAFYTGAMKPSEREAALKAIKTNPKCTVILMTLLAGAVGLDVTSCNNVIFMEPWWNPFPEEQGIGRAHRLGQTRPVHVYKVVVEETIEEAVIAKQDEKKELIGEIMSSCEADLKVKEVEEMLSRHSTVTSIV
ncbi:hypothetical protein EWM64_g2783 [Hericium alpestre]|uniref:Helicase C-terminal domain-containing protein n=1 Tax=Hericium alpestre TaxID=135208 RepID=A0A4Z0A445_9AGAM|nr:hypothetical protein EWM64_g2783 [Hericium alpestre]